LPLGFSYPVNVDTAMSFGRFFIGMFRSILKYLLAKKLFHLYFGESELGFTCDKINTKITVIKIEST